jgi:hypothetical protein
MTGLIFITVIFLVYLLWFIYISGTGNSPLLNGKCYMTRSPPRYRSHNYVHIIAESL